MTMDHKVEKDARAYFSQPGFARFLRYLQRQYEASSAGGRGFVTLTKITEDERRVLDAFYESYSPHNPQETKRYSIQLFKRLLENSRFSLKLPELFRVLNGEQAITRLERKAMADEEWEKLISYAMAAVEAIDVSLRQEAKEEVKTWGEGLLVESSPGSRTLRIVFAASRQEAACYLKQVMEALLLVRGGAIILPIRLPILSAIVTGDAHALDWKYPAGRLFWWGLTFVTGERTSRNERLQSEADLTEVEDAATDEVIKQLQISSHAILIREGYRQGKIVDDDISSQVMVFAPALTGQWEERIMTLRQVERLGKEQFSALQSTCIYVVENPSVFAELVDEAARRRLKLEGNEGYLVPFFICGNGQPTVAVIKLLDLLCEVDGTRMLYAGDLDVKGLSIAQSLQMRYTHAFHAWRMNKEQYLRHMSKGIPLTDSERNKLRNAEYTWDSELNRVMVDEGVKLHQELWADELVSDI